MLEQDSENDCRRGYVGRLVYKVRVLIRRLGPRRAREGCGETRTEFGKIYKLGGLFTNMHGDRISRGPHYRCGSGQHACDRFRTSDESLTK
jgi:hypothetical protein